MFQSSQQKPWLEYAISRLTLKINYINDNLSESQPLTQPIISLG